MITILPLTFDSIIKIVYADGSIEMSNKFPAKKGLSACSFQKINGYDAHGNRITNIVGYDGHEVLKFCPMCGKTKYVTDFDYSGRITNQKRDQSDCRACRNKYQ